MSCLRRGGALAALSFTASLLMAAPSVAQQDTVRARADSVAADSSATTATTDLPAPVVLPIQEPEVPMGPLPPGSRYSFTRDSLLWSGAVTLADLLTRIPGVYVARSGFVGQPEYIQYGGRGGSALEVFWDGVPWTAVGGDTLFTDPGTFPLTYLRQVDVEVRPTRLRVFLVSERHELLDVRSKVRVEQGAFKTARYTALFQKRARSGVSVDLAAQFVGTDGPSRTAGSDAFDVWAKLGWSPNGKVGAAYQIRRQNIDRDPLNGIPGRMGTRSEYQLALYAGTRADGMGLRAHGGVVTSAWSADSGSNLTDQSVQHAYAGIRYRRASWSVEALARVADARTPYAAEARAGWVPFTGLVLSGDARWRRHNGDRESVEVHGAAGLYWGPVYVVGEAAIGDAVQAAALPLDTAQRTVDRAIRAGIRTKWLSGQFGIMARDAYEARPYPELAGPIPGLGPVPSTSFVVAEATLRPVSALALSGWYADPLSDEPIDLQPPRHWRAALTLRSKFWRTFRSGAFDLRAQIAVESWSAGTAGRSATGNAITLPAATFWEIQLEFQLVDFTAFWTLRNARLSDAEFVPGLTYPGNGQLFGASWVFAN